MIDNTLFEDGTIVFSAPLPNRIVNKNEVEDFNRSLDEFFKEMDELKRQAFKGRPIKRFLYWLKYGE